MSSEKVSIPEEMQGRLRLVFISSAFLIAGLLLPLLRPDQALLGSMLALIGAVVIAAPILIDVIGSMRTSGFAATQFYMDQYVVLALAATLATGKYVTGGIVAIILVLGQMLEERTVLGVESALARLRKLSEVRARRLRDDGTEEEVDAAELKVGERVRIRPGDFVPTDALVISGHSQLDQANITGESLPVDAGEGAEIFAGTTNLTGLLEARVVKEAGDTVVAKVQQIIEEAKESEAPIIRMAEDYARYYTPLIILIAACVFFFTRDVDRAIAVLIVSIPCAFVLASPSAMVGAISSASRLGMLIKSTRNLELGRQIDTVVFDKTGTLTQGVLRVEEIRTHGGWTEEAALALASALEQHSNHPVAKAIREAARHLSLPEVQDLSEAPGRGVTATVGEQRVLVGRKLWLEEQGVTVEGLPTDQPLSLIHLAVDGQQIATFGLADQLRPETAEALERLRYIGIERFVMLTGDRQPVAEAIAARVGIAEFRAECLPEDKQIEITKLKESGCKVMVVGDGLNDAPALASGDLGVAMGALGNDVAVNTADVALMTNDLRRLADLLELSHRTVGIINQNLLCGFGLIVVAIVLSTAGFVSPILAAFFHEFSAFFVIFNSARLMRFDGLEEELAESNRIEPEANPGTVPALV
ncbi:MAG: cation-translocating P-type ATPase [Verrucomicrobiota bacterium JB022]|nr:cation-translocating P-type ATPase [Verrucomicrobiota bacterium JB022]